MRIELEISGPDATTTRVVALPCTIGRDEACDIRLDNNQISRQHVRIDLNGQGDVLVQDLGSANGTRIAGSAVKSAPWPAGSSLELGDYTVVYRAGNPDTPTDNKPDSQARPALLISEEVCNAVRNRIRDESDELESDAQLTLAQWVDDAIKDLELDDDLKPDVRRLALATLMGLGPLDQLLEDPDVDEIMVNGPGTVFVERGGKLQQTDLRFADEDSVLRIIERIVMPLGRRIDESSPMVDARLADGSRVNAVIPPLALDGPVLTIRKFKQFRMSAADLIDRGSLTSDMAELLETAVSMRCNLLISGGTGSGKTTLLNILSSFIPDDERIVTIEDAAELKLGQPHVVRLETRPPNAEGVGEVRIRDLVKNALRMRPDRIVVGECRGAEALDMLQAMNTGHDGSLTTVHANAPRDAIARIETMCLMADLGLPHRAIREQIVRAVDLIVQQSRFQDGTRRITEICELTGIEGDTPVLRTLFHWDAESKTCVASGFRPAFLDGQS